VADLAHVVTRRIPSASWLVRTASVALCVVALGFVSLFVLVLGRGGELALITRPLSLQVVLVLPYLVVAIALATAVGTVFAWIDRYWSLAARIHQTLLALLGLGFSWQLWVLGFVSL
jgi:hypothetical protein